MKVGSEVSLKGGGTEFLCGTGSVYERDEVGVIGGLIGDNGWSVESPSEASEACSVTAGGEPVTESSLIPAQNDWEKSSSVGARRRIGGRFLKKG